MNYVGRFPTMGKARSILFPGAAPHHETLLQGMIYNHQEKEYKRNQSTYFTKHNVGCCHPSQFKVIDPKSALINTSNYPFPHPTFLPAHSHSARKEINGKKSLSKPPPSFRNKSPPEINYPQPFVSEHKVILKVLS